MLQWVCVFYVPLRFGKSNVNRHIATETKRIDGIITKTEKEISLLQQYRTALISAVVTGKIKFVNGEKYFKTT